MLILGLNAYHGDSSACLVRDGVIVAAAEEERFRRIKHWAGFPSESIGYCLSEAGASLADVDVIAVNSDPGAALLKKVGYAVRQRPDVRLVWDRLRNQARRQTVEAELSNAFPKAKFAGAIQRVEHHLAHLASAFLVSPFREACVASIDGFGDFSSTAWGVGRENKIEIDGRIHFPHSLGIFYQALTQYLGFPHYGDEYKVMGLAPYGAPTHIAKMREIVRLREEGRFELDTRFFRHHREKISYAWEGGSPHVGTLFSAALEELLGPSRRPDEHLEQRHRDLARSVQAMYEEAFFHLLNRLHSQYSVDALALAGGCAMNSVANGKVYSRTPFKRLYVQSAAGDAGGAIGAAFAVAGEVGATAQGPRFVMSHAAWGPSYTDAEVEEVIRASSDVLVREDCDLRRIDDLAALCDETAEAIARGAVVGWFQGRMEWGPRALGNRSIIGDPRRADMKGILNAKIKRRESFRPFAPSILAECVSEWFEEDDDVPFMMQVFQIREEKRSQIPAVTHVDGSGRLQTVRQATNPLYHALISAFREITGVPMVLNTSFNENEPVVCKPEEALDCFLRTNMDVLVLGSVMIVRSRTSTNSGAESTTGGA